ALPRGGGGVAQGVQGVGALPDGLGQAGHLGNAPGVVRHRAVGVGGQGDAQGGQHAHRGDADAVEPPVKGGPASGGVEADEDGGDGGQHAQGPPSADDGGRARLRGGGQLLGGLVGVRGVVFRKVADGTPPDEAAQDGGVDPPVPHHKVGEGGGGQGGEDGG